MSKLTLEVVTPEGIVFSDKVDFVSAETNVGEVGILPNHIPLFASLKMSVLSYKKDNNLDFITVMEGFLDVNNNKVTILTEIAEMAKDIDEVRAKRSKEEAEAEMMKKAGKEAFEIAKRDAIKANVRLKALEMLEKSGIYRKKQL
ncbi:MAG: ATP synthase epsilon chain [Candidatus Sericytochromatia bacterium]|nr:MAG: ATP synthase epsilon chain [Candidatus Sericytochromatia bacterium]